MNKVTRRKSGSDGAILKDGMMILSGGFGLWRDIADDIR